METIFILLIVVFIWWLVKALVNLVRTKIMPQRPPPTSVRTTSMPQRPPSTSSVGTKRSPNVYRPSTSTHRSIQPAIKFLKSSDVVGLPTDLDIKDIVDALTGAPLQLSLGLFQCKRCKVFYQAQSFEVIKSENGGRCVSCMHTEIVSVSGRREQRGRNAHVSAITLENYRQYVGHVITFEGTVHNVLTSRRGKDYAVMFENLSWTKGFKMVVFRGCVEQIGGTRFLFSLVGHKVRVRGLLILHKKFGYEIIVSDRAMILGVQ